MVGELHWAEILILVAFLVVAIIARAALYGRWR